MKVIETPPSPAQEIMDRDRDLLETLHSEGEPILHLYEWEGPSLTYGHFIDPKQHLDSQGVKKVGLQLGRRPTGGGMVLHTSDYAFSFLLPSGHAQFSINTLENYALVNRLVIKALQKLMQENLELLPAEPMPQTPACQHFCMAKATKYDVLSEGKKVGGAAQRRKKQGLLHQGTLSLAIMPDAFLQAILPKESGVFEAMLLNSYSLLGKEWSQNELDSLRLKAKHALVEVFSQHFNR